MATAVIPLVQTQNRKGVIHTDSVHIWYSAGVNRYKLRSYDVVLRRCWQTRFHSLPLHAAHATKISSISVHSMSVSFSVDEIGQANMSCF